MAIVCVFRQLFPAFYAFPIYLMRLLMFLNYVLPFKLAAELRESFRLILISRSKFSILLVIPR